MESEFNDWVKVVAAGVGIVGTGFIGRWALKLMASSATLMLHRAGAESSIIERQTSRIAHLEKREEDLQRQVDELRVRAYKAEDATKDCERRSAELEQSMHDLWNEVEQLRSRVFGASRNHGGDGDGI